MKAWATSLGFIFCTALALAMSVEFKPAVVREVKERPNILVQIPSEFGKWKEERSSLVQVPMTADGGLQQQLRSTYDEVVERVYGDGTQKIMLSIAYIHSQKQDDKIHRPEVCYRAQGFKIEFTEPHQFVRNAADVRTMRLMGRRMLATSGDRQEVVSYWIRVGGVFSTNAVVTRARIFLDGLRGQTPDGIVVRASQLVPSRLTDEEMEKAFEVQEQFLGELIVESTSEIGDVLAASSERVASGGGMAQ